MHFYEGAVSHFYKNTDYVLVFPSAVIAASWAQRLAVDCTVVRRDRFLSWEQFKEDCFLGPVDRRLQDQRRADTFFRSIFVLQLLAKNRQNVVLSTIVPPQYRHDSKICLATILSLLPKLCLFFRHDKSILLPLLGGDLLSDLAWIHSEYGDFLNVHGRYEPAWLLNDYFFVDDHSDRQPDGAHYHIFQPELVEDFVDYAEQFAVAEDEPLPLAGVAPKQNRGSHLGTSLGIDLGVSLGIDTSALEVGTGGAANLYEFDDYRQEFYRCLEMIATLLQQGVHPGQIAITLPDYDRLYPRLQYLAYNLGISLDRRKGKPLSTYPSVAWLKTVADMAELFSFDAVRAFLLHPGLAWKESVAVANRKLIAAAIDHGLIEGGFLTWSELAENIPGCHGLFDAVKKIIDATEMDALIAALSHFCHNYLSADSWNKSGSWQRSLAVMRGLTEGLGEFPAVAVEPLTFALEQLQTTPYLPHSQEGIAVYDYRVGAGIGVDYHFCLNFNATSTTIKKDTFNFLREDIQQKLFASSAAFSDSFLQAYANSCTWISYSHRNGGGESLPSALFLANDAVQKGFKSPPKYAHTAMNAGQWDSPVVNLHRQVWSDIGSSTVGGHFIPPALSVNKLESYLHCPFGYFWARSAIEPMKLRPDIWPAARIGQVFHLAMEKIYQGITDDGLSGGRLLFSRLDEYRQIATAVLADIFADRRLLHGIPPVLLHALRGQFSRNINEVLEDGAERFNGLKIYALEHSLEHELRFEGGSFRFRGRVDCIMQDPADDGLIVLDYKTGRIPRSGDILGSMRTILPTVAEQQQMAPEEVLALLRRAEKDSRSLQLSAYCMLLRAAGEVPRMAGYYAIKGGAKYQPVLAADEEAGDIPIKKTLPVKHPALVAMLEEAVTSRLYDTYHRMEQGDFRIPPSDCPSCHSKAVCRHRFAVRMKGE